MFRVVAVAASPGFVCALVFATAMVAGTPAWAWELEWTVGAGCADEAQFRQQVEAQRLHAGDLLGTRVAVVATGDEDAGWRVHVEVASRDGAPGVREIAGASCAEVLDAAALIVALALDREPREERVVAADPAPRPPVVPARVTRLSLAAALWAGVDHGTLPALAPGLRGEAILGWRRFALVVGATQWAPATQRDAQGIGVKTSAWQVGLGLRARTWRYLALGAAFELGRFRAEGVGVSDAQTESVGLRSVSWGLSWRQPLWRDLDLSLKIDGLWHLARPSFVVAGEERHRPGLAGQVMLGLVWRFL